MFLQKIQLKNLFARYFVFSLIYQLLVFISTKAIYSNGVSWFYLPHGFVYASLLVFGPMILPVYFLNTFYSSITYAIEWNAMDVLVVSIFKPLSYYIVFITATRLLKAKRDILELRDFYIHHLSCLLISLINAVFGLRFLVREDPSQFVEGIAFWLIGDFIGVLILVPLILLIIKPHIDTISYRTENNPIQYRVQYFFSYVWIKIRKEGKKYQNLFYILDLGLILVFSYATLLLEINYDFNIYFVTIVPIIAISLVFNYKGAIFGNLMLNSVFYYLMAYFEHRVDHTFQFMEMQLILLMINFSTLNLGLVAYQQKVDRNRRIMVEKYTSQVRKFDEIGRTTAKIAHDFKNIVQIMENQVYLISRNPNIPEDSEEIQYLEKYLGKAKAKITEFLEEGKVEKYETCNVNRIISDLIPSIKQIVQPDITLDLKLSGDVFSVYAVKTQIEEVMLNIIINAKEAIDGMGNITIVSNNLRLLDSFNTGFAVMPPGEYVHIKIIDSGIGLSDDQLDYVFEPFYSTKEGGSGVGLASVFDIIKSHKGELSLYSNERETIFNIWLPHYQN